MWLTPRYLPLLGIWFLAFICETLCLPVDGRDAQHVMYDQRQREAGVISPVQEGVEMVNELNEANEVHEVNQVNGLGRMAQYINNRYMVVVRRDGWEAHVEGLGGVIGFAGEFKSDEETGVKGVKMFEFEDVVGYVADMDERVAGLVSGREEVVMLEMDQVVWATEEGLFGDMKVNFNVDEDDDDDDDDDDDGDDDGDDDQDKVSTQKPAPWNLARLSHRLHLHLNHTHSYVYPTHAGDSIVAYVVDTGVNIRHAEFDGRAKWGVTVPEGDEDVDGNGHGTHVAGTIAGKTFGVAKNAGVVAVKVLRSNGSGSMSDVVRGIQWVVEHHVNRTKEAEDLTKRDGHARKVKSVGNMSLGGGMSRILNLAVNRAFDNGVLFAVAAGNDNRDACDYSPASAEKPITVGATTIQDTRAWFSNYGKCMDIFAPGHLIESAWIGSENATNTISGTSMATPHVAGLIADFWSRSEYQKYSPKEMKKLVLHVGTKGAVSGIPKQTATKNLLAFSLPPKRIE